MPFEPSKLFAIVLSGEVIGHMQRRNPLPPDGSITVRLQHGVKKQALAVLLSTLSEAEQARALRTQFFFDDVYYREDTAIAAAWWSNWTD